MSRPITVIRIKPKDPLVNLVAAMRTVAIAGYAKELPPAYSATVQEAIARSATALDAVLEEGKTRFLHFTDYPQDFVSVVLSVDDFPEQPPCWHLSMAMAAPAGEPPRRVPDRLTKRLTTAFEIHEEGPPEGAFRNVRHFRAPYQPA